MTGEGAAPRRRELTVGVASARMELTERTVQTTFMVAVELESPAEAVRIGIANIAPNRFTVQGACCCETASATPWEKRSGSEWRHILFGGGAGPVGIPGNTVAGTGAVDVPAVLWSDWLAYRTAASGRPVLLFRILVPPQTLAVGILTWAERTTRDFPALPPLLRAAREAPGDFVTDPTLAAPTRQGAHWIPLFAVQYRSAAPGVQIVVGGDSQLAQWHNFAQQAAMALSTPALPIAVWNVARPSVPSKTFWPVLETAIEHAQPSIGVIQGWTANDGFTAAAYEQYLRRVKQSVEHTRRLGGIPIVSKSMPRKLFGTEMLAGWQRCNRELDARVPEARMFDLTPLVEQADRPGDWRAEFTSDHNHPNHAATTVMSAAFQRMLKPLL